MRVRVRRVGRAKRQGKTTTLRLIAGHCAACTYSKACSTTIPILFKLPEDSLRLVPSKACNAEHLATRGAVGTPRDFL